MCRRLDIQGKDHLKLQHNDVMLESAATSFQIHLQVNQDKGVRFLWDLRQELTVSADVLSVDQQLIRCLARHRQRPMWGYLLQHRSWRGQRLLAVDGASTSKRS